MAPQVRLEVRAKESLHLAACCWPPHRSSPLPVPTAAEFLLTLTNLFIVLGLRDAIRKAEAANAAKAAAAQAPGSGEAVSENQPASPRQ